MVGSQSAMWKRLFIVPEACSRYNFVETGRKLYSLFSGKPCPNLRQRQESWFPPPAGLPGYLSGACLTHLLLQDSAIFRVFSQICFLPPIVHLWCQSSVGGGEDDDCVVKDGSLSPFLLVSHPAHCHVIQRLFTVLDCFWHTQRNYYQDVIVNMALWGKSDLLRWLTILPTASSRAVNIPR